MCLLMIVINPMNKGWGIRARIRKHTLAYPHKCKHCNYHKTAENTSKSNSLLIILRSLSR